MSPAQEALQSRGVSMLQTGTAIGATPEGGALLVVETTQRTTRVTERVSQPVEVVTKAAGTAQRAALTETPNNPSAGLLTLADGATRHTLYVDATAVGPHTPTHHAERWLRYAVTGLLSWSRHPAVPLKKKNIGIPHMLMPYSTLNTLLWNSHVVVNNKSWCIGGLAKILQSDAYKPLKSALPDEHLSATSKH